MALVSTCCVCCGQETYCLAVVSTCCVMLWAEDLWDGGSIDLLWDVVGRRLMG